MNNIDSNKQFKEEKTKKTSDSNQEVISIKQNQHTFYIDLDYKSNLILLLARIRVTQAAFFKIYSRPSQITAKSKQQNILQTNSKKQINKQIQFSKQLSFSIKQKQRSKQFVNDQVESRKPHQNQTSFSIHSCTEVIETGQIQNKQYKISRYNPQNQTYYIQKLTKSILYPQKDDISSIFRENYLQMLSYLQTLIKKQRATDEQIYEREVQMPEYSGKKTLILDLDETLIHCLENLDSHSDIIFKIHINNEQSVEAAVNIRPYAIEFLEQMSQVFEIVIFTASKKEYADAIIDYLDKSGKYISKRLYRESCIQQNKIFIKDLRIFKKQREMKDLIVVDNCIYSFWHNFSNGVPIIPFYQNQDDIELLELMCFLQFANKCGNAVDFIKNYFRLSKYRYFNNPAELIKELY